MSEYSAPVADIAFTIEALIGLETIAELPGHEEVTADLVTSILAEAGKFAEEVLAPINRTGDLQGCVLENGVVRTPDGFQEAYRQMSESGWIGICSNPDYGGQGLPALIAIAAFEMWSGANMGFGTVPLLSLSAIDLFDEHGTEEQKQTYLPKIISGEWASTMNLTEPQAGSDLSLLRTRAEKSGDHYRITGQKIFITGGDQDLSENIVHLVLARTPDAPTGTKGISLFVVPKRLINDDGSLGERNDLRCISLEHKLGIHGSPTCVMSYGDDGGAIGYLVGQENQGLQCMFTMMNMSRTTVGVQGVGITERAYQQALSYARERPQGSRRNSDGKYETVPIIRHPDVKRMLLDMKIRRDSTRALALYTAHCLDISSCHADGDVRDQFVAKVALLTPIVKAWITDRAIEAANTGIQVHGGQGYIEETGAAQHLRDARIAAIYEGSNGIQANDLVGRKIIRERGRSLFDMITEITGSIAHLSQSGSDDINMLLGQLERASGQLSDAANWAIDTWAESEDAVLASAAKFLELTGDVITGWLMAKMAVAACEQAEAGTVTAEYAAGMVESALYFGHERLNGAPALAEAIKSAHLPIGRMDDRLFG